VSARLRELAEAVGASKGYSSILPDDEYDLADEAEQSEEDSPDGDELDSGYENPSDLEHDPVVNESATERDTNSSKKSPDEQTSPGDEAAENDESYLEDGDGAFPWNKQTDADGLDSIEPNAHSPEFNVLDFGGDNDEGQPEQYAGPKFGGKSAEGSGVFLGAHEATLNDEEEYAQLDDWLAPEEENLAFADDADAANPPLGGDDAYGNGDLAFGGDWGNEAEEHTSPAKPNSDSPLGKRARESSVDAAEPESDQGEFIFGYDGANSVQRPNASSPPEPQLQSLHLRSCA
jgi:hypothetical protein